MTIARRAIGRCLLGLCALGSISSVAAQAEDLSISNDAIEVRWQQATGHISIVSKAWGRPFLHDAALSGQGGTAAVEAVTDAKFGEGKSIKVSYPDGSGDTVTLFSKLPFAVIRARKANASAEPTVTQNVPTLSTAVDVGGHAASELKTFGTGGLLAVDKNPGSYAWLAVVDPESRNGVVFGWLSEDRGSGVLFSRTDGKAVRVDARLDYGRLSLAAGDSEELETLLVGYFNDARLGLEAWADAVAVHYDIHLPPQPVGYCTWYSKPYGGASDEKHLAELAEFSAKQLAPYGFSVVQIDDKWQAGTSKDGPNRVFLEHRPNGPYPAGMKAAAEHIASLGLTPGIWYMPFAGTSYDPYFKDHQDWFVKHDDGKPYETAWGGTCLDLTNPDVRKYVHTVADRIVNEWGFRYLKLDGLWTGTATKQQYVNSGFKDDGIGDAVYHDPNVTNIEAYRSGFKLVREAVGPKTFILGCNGPQNMRSYGGAFGMVDAMRVGPDNGADWTHLKRGPEFGSRHYFLHGRIWYNDPDPVYVRESMPLKHAELICSWVAVTGQLNLSSEWIPGLSPERLDVLKRTMPGHGLLPRPVDLFEHDPPRIWLLSDTRHDLRRDVVGLFHWGDDELNVDVTLERLGLDAGAEYEAFDYWSNERLPTIAKSLQVVVPAQSCRILSVRKRSDHPQVLSTSRHVTQGVIDVAEESWDAATRTLKGVSHVVPGDAYELRIVLPRDGNWKVRTVDAGAAESSFSTEEGLIRVVTKSPQSTDVAWAIKFAE